MRFFAITPSILLALLLALFNFAAADSTVNYNSNGLLTSENIENEMIRNYLVKRQENYGSASPSTTATTAKNSTTTATTGTIAAAATTSSTAPKMQGKSVQALPAILQDGTLFYIGISVTTLLWCTGKIIDVKMERQEKYAQSLVHSI